MAAVAATGSAAADPNIKHIQLIPGAKASGAEEDVEVGAGAEGRQLGGASKGRSRKRSQRKLVVGGAGGQTLKVAKEGGGGTSPGTLVQLAATHVAPVPGAPQPVGVNSALTRSGAAAGGGEGNAVAATPAVSPATNAPAAAPAAPVKVVLAAAKKKNNVILAAAAPKPANLPLKPAAGGGAASAAPAKTRKANRARKIKVSMKTLRKKIHRAKTIRKSAEETSLEKIKTELQKAGILKAESKAPESILRQMYADFMTLKGRAL